VTGTLVDIDSERAAIDSVWFSFKAAILADDRAAAVQHFDPAERDRYAKSFELMGSRFSEWPKAWSDLTPIDIGAEVAIYAFTQTEDDVEKVYSVSFVKHPGLGWLVSEL